MNFGRAAFAPLDVMFGHNPAADWAAGRGNRRQFGFTVRSEWWWPDVGPQRIVQPVPPRNLHDLEFREGARASQRANRSTTAPNTFGSPAAAGMIARRSGEVASLTRPPVSILKSRVSVRQRASYRCA